MMPEAMKCLLRESLPAPAWERNLSEEGGKRYLELRRDDEPALRALGLNPDDLGPTWSPACGTRTATWRSAASSWWTTWTVGTPSTGGVIFAAQERLVPTPRELRIPEDRLGDADAVAEWLGGNAVAFRDLSAQRAEAGEKWRREAISRNVREEVDLLASEPGLLPSAAAERLSLARCARAGRRLRGLSTAPRRRQATPARSADRPRPGRLYHPLVSRPTCRYRSEEAPASRNARSDR